MVSASERTLRQQPGTQNRVSIRLRDCLVELGDGRLKQRLQIDENRVLARCNQVLAVTVSRLQRIQQGQIFTLTRVEASNFVTRPASLLRHEFRPPVVTAIEHLDSSKRWFCAVAIQPAKEFLKM